MQRRSSNGGSFTNISALRELIYRKHICSYRFGIWQVGRRNNSQRVIFSGNDCLDISAEWQSGSGFWLWNSIKLVDNGKKNSPEILVCSFILQKYKNHGALCAFFEQGD